MSTFRNKINGVEASVKSMLVDNILKYPSKLMTAVEKERALVTLKCRQQFEKLEFKELSEVFEFIMTDKNFYSVDEYLLEDHTQTTNVELSRKDLRFSKKQQKILVKLGSEVNNALFDAKLSEEDMSNIMAAKNIVNLRRAIFITANINNIAKMSYNRTIQTDYCYNFILEKLKKTLNHTGMDEWIKDNSFVKNASKFKTLIEKGDDKQLVMLAIETEPSFFVSRLTETLFLKEKRILENLNCKMNNTSKRKCLSLLSLLVLQAKRTLFLVKLP